MIYGYKKQQLFYEFIEKFIPQNIDVYEIANKRLNRNLNNLSSYVKNLIARDWFQVKNSDTIFAIGRLQTENIVSGGTGYAVSCAVDNKHHYIYLNKMIINGIIMIMNLIDLKYMKILQF